MKRKTDQEASAPVSIMIRARLTPEEWTLLRKLALDLNQSTSELIGETLRELLARHTPQSVSP